MQKRSILPIILAVACSFSLPAHAGDPIPTDMLVRITRAAVAHLSTCPSSAGSSSCKASRDEFIEKYAAARTGNQDAMRQVANMLFAQFSSNPGAHGRKTFRVRRVGFVATPWSVPPP